MVASRFLRHQVRWLERTAGVIARAVNLGNVSNAEVYEVEFVWCGRTVHWTVMWDSVRRSGAPDFLFDDPCFQPLTPGANTDPGLLAQLLQALSSFQLADRAWLSGLWALLLKSYCEHQRLAIAALLDERLQFELITMPAQDRAQLQLRQGKDAFDQRAHVSLPIEGLDLGPVRDVMKLLGLIGRRRSDQPSGGGDVPPELKLPAAAVTGVAGEASGAGGSSGSGSVSGNGNGSSSGSGGAPTVAAPSGQARPRSAGSGSGNGAAGVIGRSSSGAADAPPPPPSPACRSGSGSLSRRTSSGVLASSASAADTTFWLHVTFRLPPPTAPGRQRHTDVSLQIPKWLESTDGHAQAFPLPVWNAHSCLMEYVPLVAEQLQSQVEQRSAALRVRLLLLRELTRVLGRPLEVQLQSAVALFQLVCEQQVLLLSVELGPRFPSEQPVLVLSWMHAAAPKGELPVQMFRSYPWSPRWAPSEMATRIFNFVREEAPRWLQKLAPPPPSPLGQATGAGTAAW